VSQLQVRKITGPEPAKIVVLLRSRVDRFPFPSRDNERVYVERGVADRHRDGQGFVDADTEFFEALPLDGIVRQLARLDMPADQVPTVGIPPPRRMPMHQEHKAIAHKRSH
jgi:hypothetical protein